MKTNYTTLDSGRINKEMYARLIRVKVAQGPQEPDDYVVVTYRDSGKQSDGPTLYVSNMDTVEHFSDEQEAAQYFLALMDPEEFGNPKKLLKSGTLKSHNPKKSYRWSPSVDVAKAVEAESFRREVAR